MEALKKFNLGVLQKELEFKVFKFHDCLSFCLSVDLKTTEPIEFWFSLLESSILWAGCGILTLKFSK